MTLVLRAAGGLFKGGEDTVQARARKLTRNQATARVRVEVARAGTACRLGPHVSGEDGGRRRHAVRVHCEDISRRYGFPPTSHVRSMLADSSGPDVDGLSARPVTPRRGSAGTARWRPRRGASHPGD